MNTSINDLNELIHPSWGSEQWIREGWERITAEEQHRVRERVHAFFQNGFPFAIKHDKLLYIYLFSLMAQLEVLGIQLPLRFSDKISNPSLRERMRAQLIDEIFHAIIFTKVAFMLSAPYQFPPTYNDKIEQICRFIRTVDCPKIGVVVMNLVCEGLVEEVFSVMHANNIAPELFGLVLEDEHRHVCETDLYREIGLPDAQTLEDNLHTLESLIISAFSLQSQYGSAVTALLGPRGTRDMLFTINDKHIRQLKKIGMTPSDEWDLAFQVGVDLNQEFKPQVTQVTNEVFQEISELEMSPMRNVLMTQFNAPGDPTMVAQFNVDITRFGFFDENHPSELLTPLMMQAISHVLHAHDELRHFLSYKKMHCSKGAYVTLIEKLPECHDHMGTMFFKNCHEMRIEELLGRIARNKKVMIYAYKRRALLEAQSPELKQHFARNFYEGAYDVHPFPAPGTQGVYLSNIGSFGFTNATAPLSKHIGLHATLLAVERKQVWDVATKSFVIKDFLPISFSADTRVFDGLLPIPQLINEAFQLMLDKMNHQNDEDTEEQELFGSEYHELADKFTSALLNPKNLYGRRKLLSYLISKKSFLKKIKSLYQQEIKESGLDVKAYISEHLMKDCGQIDLQETLENDKITRLIDKLLHENKELGHRILYMMQTGYIDYVDVEKSINELYQKIANTRLHKLVKILPKILG